MMKKLIPILLIASGFAEIPMQNAPNSMVTGNKQLVINNRPLIKIQGKTISLMDVVKKIDLTLHANYPQAKESQAMLYQYYSQNWRRTLDDMIMEQLIIADSEGKEMKVSEADVRQEMDRQFGPNVILSLNKIGLTYEEGKELIKNDLTVQRLLWYRVYSKAQANIRPEDIKLAYTTYINENPAKEEWEYDVLTVRGDDEKNCAKIAQEASTLLGEKAMELATLATSLSEKHSNKSLKIVASKDYKVDTKTISTQHREALAELAVGESSRAIKQASRIAGGEVYRIFHLKSHNKIEPENFDVMHNKLKEELFGHGAQQNREEYHKLLREMFGYTADELDKIVPSDYQPFALR
jgi:hypothetical protein